MRTLATISFSFAGALLLAAYILPAGWALPACAAFAVMGALALLLRGGVRKRACLILFGAAAGLLFRMGAQLVYYAPAAELDGASGVFEAVVSDFSKPTDYGSVCEARIGRVSSRLYIRGDSPELSPGDRLELEGELSLTDELYGEQSDAFLSRGCFLFAYADRVTVTENPGLSVLNASKYMGRALQNKISEIYSHDTAPFMQALLAGFSAPLYENEGFLDALNVSGVRHVVVVSGMHLAYLTGIVSLLFGRRRRVAAVSVPVIFVFMAMTGFSPSVVRAGVMQIFLMAAPMFDREGDSLTSLSAALLLLLAINPYSATNLGLQLTFTATLGIVLLSGRVYTALDERLRRAGAYGKKPVKRLLRFIIANLSTTIGASALTIPIIAVRLHYVSIIAPLTNLLTAWAVALAFSMGLAAVLLGFIYTPLGVGAAFIAALPARYTCFIVEALGSVRFASVYTVNAVIVYWLLYAAAAVLLIFLFRKREVRVTPAICAAAAALCAVLLLTYADSEKSAMEVTVLDVGQGQCIVVTSGTAAAVIDCGSSSGEDAGTLASQYLRSLGRKRADVFILTHYHADHANGAEELLDVIEVDALLAPDESVSESYLTEELTELANGSEVDVIYVRDRTTITLGEAKIELYPPLDDDSENELGLIAVCTAGDFDVLVTGDVPSSIERRLIYKYELPDIEALVVGHHGSEYSTSEELLEAVTPETAVISVGYNNYGHPSEKTLARLASAGIKTYRTDISGNITIDVGETDG